MTQSSKEEALKKWAPIIESMGVTGSKADWMSQYVEMHSINENNTQIQPSVFDQTSNFPILPVAKRIFSKTVGLDLVAVQPIGVGNSSEQLKDIRDDIKIENRDRLIESIIDDKEYKEMTVEEHPDYIKTSGPSGQLFYMDYTYGGATSSTHKKTRRSKKK